MAACAAALCLSFTTAPAVGQTASTSGSLTAQPAAENGGTTSALISRAIRLTSERKLQDAEQLYREAAKLSPAEGYPLLARFLHRTGNTTAASELLSMPEIEQLPVLPRARVAVAAGQPQRAIELLQNTPLTGSDLYQRSALLATQLVAQGKKGDAAAFLEKAVSSPALAPVDRRDLFLKLSVIGGPDHVGRVLPPLMDNLIAFSSLTYPQLRDIAVQAMIVISGSDAYTRLHQTLANDRKSSPSQAWLYALSMVRKGDPGEARAALESYTTASLSAREKCVVYEELARLITDDPERARSLYEQLIPIAPDSDRLRLITAQMYFGQKNYAKVAELLRPVNERNFDEGELGVFKNLYLASTAAAATPEELVRVFEEQTRDLPYEKIRELAEAPFVTLPQSSQKGLRTALEKRLQETTSSNQLYVLQMSYENQLGTPDRLMEALGKYVDAHPTVIQAAEEYANAAGQQAYTMITGGMPGAEPTPEQKKEVGDRAARALWRVIKTRPYAPEPYIKLIELYRLYGHPDLAERVPLALTEQTTATAEEYHLAGYISAQADLATQSLPLYERALEMDPGNTRFRLNYAGALSRVGRVKDADKIYRDVIEHGVAGRQYHAHEVYANAFRLASTNGFEEDYLKFIKGLIPRTDIPQHDVFLVEMGKVMIGMEHPNDAIPFLQGAIERYPQHRYQAADLLVHAYVAAGKFAEAEKTLALQEKESTDTASLVLVRSNYAATKAARGELAAAVAEWKRLAAAYPQERSASRLLITAAEALIKEGRLRAATELLETYLSKDYGDPDGEATARESLNRIRKKDLPSDVLVKSAMEDVAPAVQ